jgi:hypothetical protein
MDAKLTRHMRDALEALAFALVDSRPAVIAGGFAAQWWSAGDIDLWMLGDPMLEKVGLLWQTMGIKSRRPSEAESSIAADDRDHAVAVLDTPLMAIHVIGTELTSTRELLNTFDISTHRWAITREGMQISGMGATTPFETGRVLAYPFPESTDARVKRLQARYDITILPYVDPKSKKTRAKPAA